MIAIKSISKFHWTIIIIVLVKLWLVADLSITALPMAGHDDMLFFCQAVNLFRGDWLGDYNNLTLAKGPFFSIFLALSHFSGLSFMICQQLFYILACLLVIRVLKSIISSNKILGLLFAFIIFNPITYSEVLTRLIRESIYPALAIFTLFSFIGIINSFREKERIDFKWPILAGLFLSFFWLTREDGIWLIPSIIILMGYFVLTEWIGKKKLFQPKLLIVVLLPFLILLFSIQTISIINKINYGVYEVVEFKNKEFIRAYAAVTRVEGSTKRIKYIPSSMETRKLLYDSISAFSELRAAEETVFQGWAKANPYCNAIPETCGEMAGGWFMWAFRDAVASKGYYKDGKTAEVYYKRLANEINSACDCGRLNCLPERNTLLPRIDNDVMKSFVVVFFKSWNYVVKHIEVGFEEGESIGDSRNLHEIQEFTRSKIARKSTSDLIEKKNSISNFKRELFRYLGVLYSTAVPIMFYLSLFTFFCICVFNVAIKNISLSTIVAFSLLVGISCRIAILALVDVTSFPAISYSYLSPVYPLVYIFIIVVYASVADIFWQRRIKK